MTSPDVIIIGAGAAGLMCAIETGKRGRSVVVLEHNETVGEKIRISGGGRCNFTNTGAGPDNYLSENPHFCTSALARYTPADFISLVESRGIDYYEKKLGQLFCTGSAQQIIDLLVEECRGSGVRIVTGCRVNDVRREPSDAPDTASMRFAIESTAGSFTASSLVIATGGISVPKLGATPFGYRVAERFGLKVIAPRPGLVPLKFGREDARFFHALAGISLDVEVRCRNAAFRENMLFTHQGLSGPAILQISSYWSPGVDLTIDLLPGMDARTFLAEMRPTRKELSTILEQRLPSRFVRAWLESRDGSRPMTTYAGDELARLAHDLSAWRVTPAGTEGYGKAEVTVGGVDTAELSSKTMEARKVPGLFFIGEVVDVTGWLGGYNFQWAWASGWAAGQTA